MGMKQMNFMERLAQFAATRTREECWVWPGSLATGGYGLTPIRGADGKKRTIGVHRLAYEAVIGPIPDGLQIDHLCRNRACFNPYHLEAVSGHENWRRGESPSALHSRKTHCSNGHAFDEANTWVSAKRHQRVCKTCTRIRVRAYYIPRKKQEA